MHITEIITRVVQHWNADSLLNNYMLIYSRNQPKLNWIDNMYLTILIQIFFIALYGDKKVFLIFALKYINIYNI